MKTILGIVTLGVIVGGLYALNEATRSEDGKSVLHVAEELPLEVELTTPEQRDIIRTVQAPGDVEACSEVDISAEVLAKILEMPVEEGDIVKKGDLLCRLDDADYRAMITSAKANVAKLKAIITQANADLEKSQRDVDRQIQLSEADATSSTELADYHTILVRARAAVEVRRQELIEAQARLQRAREDLAKTVIEAPIDGVVSQLFAEQGEVVVTGTMNNAGTRIMVISDLSKMQIRCRVDETDAPLVKDGQVAQIYLQSENDEPVRGRVLRVATKGTKPLGRDVVTFETLVLVESPDFRIKPGMTANVEIEVARSDNALTIPVQAVVHRKRRNLPDALVARFDELQQERTTGEHRRLAEYLKVIYYIEDDTAHPRLIDTGISDDIGVEILKGVSVGDRVVIGPFRSLDQLKDGSAIKIEDEESEKEEEGALAEVDTRSEPRASARADAESETDTHVNEPSSEAGADDDTTEQSDVDETQTLAENKR